MPSRAISSHLEPSHLLELEEACDCLKLLGGEVHEDGRGAEGGDGRVGEYLLGEALQPVTRELRRDRKGSEGHRKGIGRDRKGIGRDRKGIGRDRKRSSGGEKGGGGQRPRGG